MQQLLETILEELRGAWRFRWYALAVAWTVSVLAWFVILFMRDSYQAQARVFVDTQTTLSAATRDITVEGGVDTQIQGVRQALLGGPHLQKVAEETNLTANALTPQDKQRIIDSLRDEIWITGGLTRESPTAGVYVIAYSHQNRDTSLRVVERLVNTFVEGTLGGKREGSAQAQQFLVAQISDYEQRLRQAEERLAAFKKDNVGLMPGAQGDYFTRLQAELDQLGQAETNLSVATQRREELQKQLRGEQPFITAGGTSSYVPSAPIASGSDTASRIRETQTRLDEMLLRFTEKHPDVVALKNTLKELEERQAQEIAAARSGDSSAAARIGLNANPVFQNLQLQYNQVGVEIAALRADIGNRQRKVANLRSLVDTAPEVEAEFARLNRDYDVTKAQHQALVKKLEQARLGEEAAATGVVRFEVIDPPSASFKPVAPNRPLLIAASLVVAFGLGGGIAYLLHLLKPVFTSSRQLNGITGLPVLGVVSMTWIDRYKAAQRRGTIVYAGAAAALVMCVGVVLVLQNRLTQLVHGLTS
jgi:polysaccharide chain length determinant protein (PEP-CTERM system associated)